VGRSWVNGGVVWDGVWERDVYGGRVVGRGGGGGGSAGTGSRSGQVSISSISTNQPKVSPYFLYDTLEN
jgi:hypothetical protein